MFIPFYHHSPQYKLWPSAHFYHAGVHSSLITPFRWYKLGLSHTVSVMDYRGQYETHWSISWISFCVSRLCNSGRASLLVHACSAWIKNSASFELCSCFPLSGTCTNDTEVFLVVRSFPLRSLPSSQCVTYTDRPGTFCLLYAVEEEEINGGLTVPESRGHKCQRNKTGELISVLPHINSPHPTQPSDHRALLHIYPM